ncbi:MAG: GAF domain-containing sensor histidine kinase [Bacteroidetes bacterium]|nr:MAG: GAF domain-containing sensor histidine kinase [Bacteroidota bacterium]TAG90650.1 MAG: GAF domain-containing sensor histidine kinase [Bacteroidota bacterium]
MNFEPNKHAATSPPSLSHSSEWLVSFKQLPEVSEGNLEKILPILTETLAKNLQVSRVSIWELSENQTCIVCLDAYHLAEDIHTKGSILRSEIYPRYFNAIINNNIIKADEVERHPFTREFVHNYFKEHNIKSMLDVPFYDDGVLKGVICYENLHAPRVWTNEEVMYTNCMGMIISLVYEKIRLKLCYRQIQDLYTNAQIHNQQLEQQKSKIENQTVVLQEQQSEIIAQNEELRQQQEEMETQSNLLAEQNMELQRAQTIINAQNEQLSNHNISLENKIFIRTKELAETNEELITHNHQLEQFAYITAHNLRSPVARILGLVSLLNQDGLGTENQEIIKHIINCTSELDRVIKDLNQILEVKKGQQKPLENVKISEIWETLSKEFKNEIDKNNTHIDIDLSVVDELKTIRPYLESVLYNLLSNAIKYKKENVNLSISVKTQIQNEKIELIFADNGIGINLEKYKQKVFGLYQRFHSHVEGKGMGLYLVRTQVETMGGKINIESEEGKGTTFIISFPIAAI